jgi:surface antigen
MVFPFSKYGHVGIVTKIEQNKVEIIQQNVLRSTRAIYDIKYKNGVYSVSNANGMNKPIGWLRKK